MLFFSRRSREILLYQKAVLLILMPLTYLKSLFLREKNTKRKNENFYSSTCNLSVSIFYEILLENSRSCFFLYLLVSLLDFKQFDIERRIKKMC